MAKYFALKLYPDKNGFMDHGQVTTLRETLEHIGSRWSLSLSEFTLDHGQIRFQFDRDNNIYDILENIADELGVHPSAISSVRGPSGGVPAVWRTEGGAE